MIGYVAPALAALITMPIIIERMGTSKFGFLTIAWALIGYFGVFDLGLGRAITHLVSEELAQKDQRGISSTVSTGTQLLIIVGFFGTIIVGVLSLFLGKYVTPSTGMSETEVSYSLYAIALCIPIITMTSSVRGILEAFQKFSIVNAVRLPTGVLTFAAPLVVLPWSDNVFLIILSIVVIRIIGLILYMYECKKLIVDWRLISRINLQTAKRLMKFGGWMTVSNLLSPAMNYLDRFFIVSYVGLTMVAYYSTSFEVSSKLAIIPVALAGVLFPSFSGLSKKNINQLKKLYYRGVIATTLLLVLPVLLMVLFSFQGLSLWLGDEFAQNSYVVFILLTVGFFINGIAHIPFNLIQGLGKPNITAILHIFEFILYLLLAVWLIPIYGIIGAAIAWVARASVDAVLLFLMADRLLRNQVEQQTERYGF
jgi:O-antigen/teichoic acid export membrane protein